MKRQQRVMIVDPQSSFYGETGTVIKTIYCKVWHCNLIVVALDGHREAFRWFANQLAPIA